MIPSDLIGPGRGCEGKHAGSMSASGHISWSSLQVDFEHLKAEEARRKILAQDQIAGMGCCCCSLLRRAVVADREGALTPPGLKASSGARGAIESFMLDLERNRG